MYCLHIEALFIKVQKKTPFMLLYGREARIPLDIMINPTVTIDDVNTSEYRNTVINKLKEAHALAHDNIEVAQSYL